MLLLFWAPHIEDPWLKYSVPNTLSSHPPSLSLSLLLFFAVCALFFLFSFSENPTKIASRGAHDPQEQAREKAMELEDLRRREQEAVDRLANEALQVKLSGWSSCWLI